MSHRKTIRSAYGDNPIIGSRFEECLARIRQKNHRMGPDVPYWVQDQLDIAYSMLIGMRSGLWMGALFGAIVVAIYSLYAIGHELSPCGMKGSRDAVLNCGIIGAMMGLLFARPKCPEQP